MAAIGFDDGTYIELDCADKGRRDRGLGLGKVHGRGSGDVRVGCGHECAAQEVDRLKKAGIAVTTPRHGSRKRPDGMSVEWTTADVGSGTPGSVTPFIIEDETPRAWRVQASASVKGAPVSGVENIVIAVGNLDASVAMFRKAYGWSEPLMENQKDWGRMAYFPGEPVILVAASGGWIADQIAKFGESPVAILLAGRDFPAAVKKYKLGGTKTWFGQKVAWFDAAS